MKDILFVGKTKECQHLIVHVDSDEFYLDSESMAKKISIDESVAHRVTLSDCLPVEKRTFLQLFWGIITLPIQGILHALLQNSDLDWYKEYKPFRYEYVLIDGLPEEKLSIFYQKGKYDIERNAYQKPQISFEPPVKFQEKYYDNSESLSGLFYGAIQQIISVELDLLIMFLFFVYLSISLEMYYFSGFLALLIAVNFVVLSKILLHHWKIYQKLKSHC